MENEIIPKDDIKTFEKIAMFRNLLVYYYEKVDDEIVFGVFHKNLDDIERFMEYVLNYIDR